MDYPKTKGLNLDTSTQKFTDGDIATNTPPSIDSADSMNAIYDEIINVIIRAGLIPQEDNNTQLYDAISGLIPDENEFSTRTLSTLVTFENVEVNTNLIDEQDRILIDGNEILEFALEKIISVPVNPSHILNVNIKNLTGTFETNESKDLGYIETEAKVSIQQSTQQIDAQRFLLPTVEQTVTNTLLNRTFDTSPLNSNLLVEYKIIVSHEGATGGSFGNRFGSETEYFVIKDLSATVEVAYLEN